MVERTESVDRTSPFNIVFSCAVCQKTLEEIYPNGAENTHSSDKDSNQAPRDYSAKAWLTECTHLTCSDHFPPDTFSNQSEPRPSAICLLCSKERGDSKLKKLFAVRGPTPADCDPKIPALWFETPPIKLNESTPEISALRFQYVSLSRYGVMMHSKFKKLLTNFNRISAENNQISEDLRSCQMECLRVRSRNEELKKKESELNEMKKRSPEVKHYLHSFTILSKENDELRQHLASLGYQIPPSRARPAPMSDGQMNQQANSNVNESYSRPMPAQTSTIPSSPPEINGYFESHHTRNASSGRKRRREDDRYEQPYVPLPLPPGRKPSVELMPPPAQLPIRGVPQTPSRFSNQGSFNLVTPRHVPARSQGQIPPGFSNHRVETLQSATPRKPTYAPTPQRQFETTSAALEQSAQAFTYPTQDDKWANNGITRQEYHEPNRQLNMTPQRTPQSFSQFRYTGDQNELASNTPLQQSHHFRPPTRISASAMGGYNPNARFNFSPASTLQVPQMNHESHYATQFTPIQTPSRQHYQPQGTTMSVRSNYAPTQARSSQFPSLNSLSFIKDPYTDRQPIYTTPSSQTMQNIYSDDSQRYARPPSGYSIAPSISNTRQLRPLQGLSVEDTSSSVRNYSIQVPTRNALRGYGRPQYPSRPPVNSFFHSRSRSSMGHSSYGSDSFGRRRIAR